ncbi:MAG: glycosyltransferase family 4 protein [Colwellia sp.]
MNILFLSNTIGQDNRDNLTYNFILKEAKALNDCNCKVIHFHSSAKDTLISEVLFTGRREFESISRMKIIFFLLKNIKTYLTLILVNVKQALWAAKLELAIGEVIKKYDIDIVHTHFMYPMGLCAANICKTFDIPIVSSLRGAEVCNLPHYSYGALQDVFFRKASLIGARASQVITTPNIGMRAKAAKLFKVSKSKMKYLPNGVDNSILSYELNPSKGGDLPIKLLSIGRLIPLKNHLSVLEAIKGFDSSFIELTLVGEGPLYNELVNYTKENCLSNVTFIEEMPKEKLFQTIAQTDFLIHPSLSEGLPNVVLEALALGKPCLVSEIDAHFDLITEGYNGYFFKQSEPKEIERVIQRVCENYSDDLSENCLESIKNFTIEKKIIGYKEIYKSLLLR